MIDLVLQDTCVPTMRSYRDWFCSLVQTFDAYTCTTANDCGKSFDTETPFEKVHGGVTQDRDLRINNYVEIDRRSLALDELLRRNVFDVIDAILYHCQLDRLTNLRSCKTNARRRTHRVAHLFNQTL